MQSQQTIDTTWFKQCLANQELVQKLKDIKLVVCDVDGSLTDAGIYVTDNGEGGRTFSIQDGYIFRPAIAAGIQIALMSGKSNLSTMQRAKMIGVPEEMCIVGMLEKPQATKKLQEQFNLTPQQTIIFGDDFLDARVKEERVVSLFICPDNAPFYILALADLIVPRGGGNHAFRLFADLLLYVQEKHFAQNLIDAALRQ